MSCRKGRGGRDPSDEPTPGDTSEETLAADRESRGPGKPRPGEEHPDGTRGVLEGVVVGRWGCGSTLLEVQRPVTVYRVTGDSPFQRDQLLATEPPLR